MRARTASSRRCTTLLIRVGANGSGWRVELYRDDGSDDWLVRPVASDLLPGCREEFAPPQLASGRAGFDAIREVLLTEEHDSSDFHTIGAHLHDVLTRGAVGAEWQQVIDEHSGLGRTDELRLLLDAQPKELSLLPWELLSRGQTRLAADVSNPFARVTRGYPGAGELALVRWPLRVLVVVGSPEDDKVVAAEQEVAMLTEAFRRMCGLVAFELLPQPSRKLVQERFKALRPHIFHFIGHGSVGEAGGRLELYDAKAKRNEAWTIAKIHMDLSGWQPRLAILNACRTSDLAEQEGAWSVADEFRSLGVPAVIAMQADIRGDAAAAFTRGVYGALANGAAIDVAVAAGRRAITEVVDELHRDFALPSLTVSAPPDSVLRLGYGVDDDLRPQVESVHPRFKAFVDRTAERQRLMRGLDAVEPEHDPDVAKAPPLTTIVGSRKVGKTELARWCVSAAELHGGNAAYVDLGTHDRLEYLTILRAIRDALVKSPLHGAKNEEAFGAWDESSRGASAPTARNDVVEAHFDLFGDALRQAARRRPLLVVLDNVGRVQERHWRFICDFLLKPVATHALAPVRAIVVLSDDQRKGWLSESVEELQPPNVELKRFPPSEFKAIAGQYARYHFDVGQDVVDAVLGDIAERMESDFAWDGLKTVEGLANLYGWDRYS